MYVNYKIYLEMILRNIIVKLFKVSDKDKILKIVRGVKL